MESEVFVGVHRNKVIQHGSGDLGFVPTCFDGKVRDVGLYGRNDDCDSDDDFLVHCDNSGFLGLIVKGIGNWRCFGQSLVLW